MFGFRIIADSSVLRTSEGRRANEGLWSSDDGGGRIDGAVGGDEVRVEREEGRMEGSCEFCNSEKEARQDAVSRPSRI